jgi:hypothetical protein
MVSTAVSRLHISVDSRKLLVERVASSRYIGKSARLRALLVYLCEQVLEHDAQEIHEQEVGRAVFGRRRITTPSPITSSGFTLPCCGST